VFYFHICFILLLCDPVFRAYSHQIRALTLASFLPHKKQTTRLIFDTPDHTIVHMVEDIVYFSLTEINQPLSFIPETPFVTPPTSTHFDPESFEFEEVDFSSENLDNVSDNMENKNEEIL
jgi:hypothetical protein